MLVFKRVRAILCNVCQKDSPSKTNSGCLNFKGYFQEVQGWGVPVIFLFVFPRKFFEYDFPAGDGGLANIVRKPLHSHISIYFNLNPVSSISPSENVAKVSLNRLSEPTIRNEIRD